MMLTYKIKHGEDFSRELGLARKVAEFAIANRDKLSTKYVAHLGLKSVIANQILRKYGRNRKAKVVNSVNLTVPNQGIKYRDGVIRIPALGLSMGFRGSFEKINQIEIDDTFVCVSVSVREAIQYVPETNIGVDINTTGHCAVIAVKRTGKVYKLGKKAEYIHLKYRDMRQSLQRRGLYRVVKRAKNRENRIIKDLNHKISRFIVNLAIKEKGGIHLENLRGICKTTKQKRGFRYALHSWSFYQLGQFIEYKALLAGVPVAYIEPAYTSQVCSRCGLLGERNRKSFKCLNGHVEHADSNAAFNLAFLSPSIARLQAERDVCKRSTDTRREATLSG